MTEKTITIPVPVETDDIKAAKENARELCERALTFRVATLDDFKKASEIRLQLNLGIKKIKETFKPMIDKNKEVSKQAREAVQVSNQLLDKALKPFEYADKNVTAARLAFTKEQERKDRIEREKLEEKARKQAQKDRERLQAQEFKAREKAQALFEAGKKEQADSLLESADDKKEQAEQVYEKPVAVAPTVDRKTTMNGGTLYNKEDAVVHLPESRADIIAFCRAVADGNMETECVRFSLTNIKSWAKLTNTVGKKYGVLIEKKTSEIFKG